MYVVLWFVGTERTLCVSLLDHIRYPPRSPKPSSDVHSLLGVERVGHANGRVEDGAHNVLGVLLATTQSKDIAVAFSMSMSMLLRVYGLGIHLRNSIGRQYP